MLASNYCTSEQCLNALLTSKITLKKLHFDKLA